MAPALATTHAKRYQTVWWVFRHHPQARGEGEAPSSSDLSPSIDPLLYYTVYTKYQQLFYRLWMYLRLTSHWYQYPGPFSISTPQGRELRNREGVRHFPRYMWLWCQAHSKQQPHSDHDQHILISIFSSKYRRSAGWVFHVHTQRKELFQSCSDSGDSSRQLVAKFDLDSVFNTFSKEIWTAVFSEWIYQHLLHVNIDYEYEKQRAYSLSLYTLRSLVPGPSFSTYQNSTAAQTPFINCLIFVNNLCTSPHIP